MASVFGQGLYGHDVYSRDFTGGTARIGAVSGVAVQASVHRDAMLSINAAASVNATGRLLWDHVAVPPCEGTWQPLVNPPCREEAA